MRHSKDFRNQKLGYPVDRVSEKAEPVEKPDEKPAVKPEAPAGLDQSIEKLCSTILRNQKANEARFKKNEEELVDIKQTNDARFKKTEEELVGIRGQLNELIRVTSGQKGQVTKLNAMAINQDARIGQMYTEQQVREMFEQMLRTSTAAVTTPAPMPVASAVKPQPAPAPVAPAVAPQPAPAPVVEPASTPVVESAAAPAPQPVPVKKDAPRYVGTKKYWVLESLHRTDENPYDLNHPFETPLDAEASGRNWATWRYWVCEDGSLVPFKLNEMSVSSLNSRKSLLN